MSEAVTVYDLAGKILLANQAMQDTWKLWGLETAPETYQECKSESGPGARIILMGDGREFEPGQDPFARVLQGECFSRYEVQVRLKETGWVFYYCCNGSPICDDTGKLQAGLVTMIEITGRKQAEEDLRDTKVKYRELEENAKPLEQLRESEQKYKDLIKYAPAGIFEVDLQRNRFRFVIEIDLERKIKEYLAFRCGMKEIYTYPWMSDEYVNAVLQNTNGILSLSTPPAPNERYLRSSLLPNLCKSVSVNQRYFNEFAIFEAAQILQDREYKAQYDVRESLPLQRRNIAGAFVDNPESVPLLFRKAKGVLEIMPRYTHMEPFIFQKVEKPVWADNVVWINICLSGKIIGNLAPLSKKVTLDCGIKNNAVMLFELDIDSLKPYLSRSNSFIHLPECPITDYDVSMLFDLSVKWEEIHDVILSKKGENELVQQASFVEEYKGKQVPEGKKSVTIRLVIGSPHKTLTSNEIESNANAAINRLTKHLGAELRN